MIEKSIVLQNKKINYILRKNIRARSMRLTIRDAQLFVTVPRVLLFSSVENFILQKADWIIRNLEAIPKDRIFLKKLYPQMSYRRDKYKARSFIKARLICCNEFYNFSYNRICIKNNKGNWGSCSSKNNLNFNYRLVFLPQELADYVIIHELCHLKEMNHSKKFWELVSLAVPDYKRRIKELKKFVF